jgi:hypothetical protein
MTFKQAKWEAWESVYSVARMAFGIQLTIVKSEDKWIWETGNLSFVVKQGKCNSESMAKANAERAFHRYVMENLEKCTE